MKHRPLAWAFVGAAGVLSACAVSPPIRFYTLTEIAPVTPVDRPSNAVPVRIDRVTLPVELDRAQLVRRIDSTRLQIEDLDRWAGPLDEIIGRALAADLSARLPAPSEQPRSLTIKVQDFYADSACNVSLRAEWILRQPGTADVRAVEALRSPSIGACTASAITQVMSRALADLSDRIATVITTR